MSLVFSFRLKEKDYEILKQCADEAGHSVSLLARNVINKWISQQEKQPLTRTDKIQVQGLSEALYILRTMADRFEPNLKDAARMHAEQRLNTILEES